MTRARLRCPGNRLAAFPGSTILRWMRSRRIIFPLLTASLAVSLGSGQIMAQEIKSPPGLSTGPADAAGRLGSLVRVITTIVEPDCWDGVGGPGNIVAVDRWGLLIVSQTGHVHQQIEDLIATIRRARLQQGHTHSQPSEHPAPGREVVAARSVSLVAEHAQSIASRTEIEQALSSETSFEFFETPLAQAVVEIRERHGVRIHLDSRSLKDEVIDENTPVTMNVSGISLRSALRLMLRDLDLTYSIDGEVLLITTPVSEEEELQTRVYMVEDLVIPSEQVGSGQGEGSQTEAESPATHAKPASDESQ